VQGRAISVARVERKPRTFSGRSLRRVIQKPTKPMPRRTSTDSRTIIKTSIYTVYFILPRGRVKSCEVSFFLYNDKR